jgi:hypothetical protein
MSAGAKAADHQVLDAVGVEGGENPFRIEPLGSGVSRHAARPPPGRC